MKLEKTRDLVKSVQETNLGGDFSCGGMFAEAIWLYAGNSNRLRVETGDLVEL